MLTCDHVAHTGAQREAGRGPGGGLAVAAAPGELRGPRGGRHGAAARGQGRGRAVGHARHRARPHHLQPAADRDRNRNRTELRDRTGN